MQNFKKYIGCKLIGETLRFKCDCVIPVDIVGVIKDIEIVSNEIIFITDCDGRIIKIGENHPNLFVEDVHHD
jgi:hypothetical protein